MRIAMGRAFAIFVMVGALGAASALAADEPPQIVRPGYTSAGAKLTLTPPPGVDLTKGAVLRLTGPETHERPITRQEGGRLFTVTLPTEMRQGRYRVEIVNDQDTVLAKGQELRIRAKDAPKIIKVVPHPSYPDASGYSFEIHGENFAYDVQDTDIKINGKVITFPKDQVIPDPRHRLTDDASCKGKFPCLIGNRRELKIYGLSLDSRFYRPMHVVVEVDSLPSEDKPLILSQVPRNMPRVIAFVVLGVLAGVVYLMARTEAAHYRPFDKRYRTLSYLLIEQETNTFSLSRLQLLTWTAAAVLAYAYVYASQYFVQAKWQMPEVPSGLATLLGLSVGTTALAIGATEIRGSKGAGPAHPGIGDLISNGGVFASDRLQFFLWTILGVVAFVHTTLSHDPATLTEPPKIPDSFLPLMGVSSLGYLAGKVLRKPGPVIKQVEKSPPDGLRILGENLSPRAQVFVGSQLVASDKVRPATPVAENEFAKELVVTGLPPGAAPPTPVTTTPAPPEATGPSTTQVPAPPATPSLKVRVVNPDGQSAEI